MLRTPCRFLGRCRARLRKTTVDSLKDSVDSLKGSVDSLKDSVDSLKEKEKTNVKKNQASFTKLISELFIASNAK
ncbi:hypothetical protein Taro_012097 [Colocasia esculenta]|uniref:Uncharacterized protein n=1 Tax=Colocasia esculenta TaxID=4460 RepID=A0A843U855_COLES|nr:hypothetical protein [Colocasia esculenta]